MNCTTTFQFKLLIKSQNFLSFCVSSTWRAFWKVFWRLDRRDSQLSNSFWSFELNHHICKMLLNVKTCLDLSRKRKKSKKDRNSALWWQKIALTCKVWLHCGTVYVWPIRQIGKISNRNLASRMQKASLLCVVWKKRKNTTI